MDFSKRWVTDTQKELDGVLVDLGHGEKVRLARLGNPRYTETYRKLAEPHKTEMRIGKLSKQTSDEILAQALAKDVLLEIIGFELNGKVLENTYENRLKLLTMSKDFRNEVVNLSTEMETFKAQEDKESEKNSESASAGD